MKTQEINHQIALGLELPLMEEFYTIQGEGYHKGRAAYFIRLAGCDVGCHWCDVKESWDADIHPVTPIEKMVQHAGQYPGEIAVITGGEPTMYNLSALTEKLKAEGLRTHIETSGAYQLTGEWDWICLSPKKRKLPTAEVHQKANELKMVIYNRSDFDFAEEQATLVSEHCKLYLQPEWSVREKMMPLMIDYVLNHPKWTISLQTHKYLDVR